MKPARFSDCSTSECLDFPSEWRTASTSSHSIDCQTDSELFQTADMDIQTGQSTNIYQEIVAGKSEGMSLLERFSKFSERSRDQWSEVIADGFISINGEVVTDPSRILHEEELVEYVNYKHHVYTQTLTASNSVSGGKFIAEEKEESEFGRMEKGSKDDFVGERGERDAILDTFLRRVLPTVEAALLENLSSSAFDGYELIEEPGSDVVSYWKTLSVDLEKRKVTYPDWSNAKYYSARVHSCSLTRNKERVYDIEFDDGGTLPGVREVAIPLLLPVLIHHFPIIYVFCTYVQEYIRILEDREASEDSRRRQQERRKQQAAVKLPEGIRVHAKVAGKSGAAKYLPGRITKVHKGRDN